MTRAARFASALAISALVAGCSRAAEGPPSTGTRSGELSFTGMCDASGAVQLNETHFAVADDEDNVLRVYDAARGGAPIFAVDVSEGLNLAAFRKRKKKLPTDRGKAPETDIEAGTRVGDLAFWITSHGRNSSGKLKPERLRFFATTAPERGSELKVVGAPYERLLEQLFTDPRFVQFDLARAAERAPKAPGGLNIEGLTARAGGGVFIGLRNPTFEGKALVFALMNPEQVVQGATAQLGDPILLDLGGLGVRSLSFWRGRYLLVAGHFTDGVPSRLYVWDGRGAPAWLEHLEFRNFNPEGFFTPDSRSDILLLSDDGSIPIGGVECKRLDDPAQKRFRGRWLMVPGAG
jgi:hypothetical protein